MFVPPVLREWVADNELAHLAFKAVEFSESARLNARASGSEQYPPTMMLALVIYSYATDLISSRRIERATYDNVTVRYLCANHPPIIAKFGRENEALFRRIRTTITLSKSWPRSASMFFWCFARHNADTTRESTNRGAKAT
ncbi:MAG: hypothetical protein DME99_02405 [Verrucomicrobia bacterium]|nr:MAG: hypothetical protein DME99_02405 [Verrucomicrobiota bacterium]